MTVKPHAHESSHLPILAAVILAALGFMFLAGSTSAKTVEISVDGHSRVVRTGATVNELVSSGIAEGKAGDLIGVNGAVLRRAGGAPAMFIRNGRAVRLSARLYAGDVLVSAEGLDLPESVVTTDVAIPFEVVEEGAGPLAELRVLGAPGVRRVRMGEASGFELSSRVMREPTDMVVAYARPANGKVVALTFDDGPGPGSTPGVLGVLEKYHVKATFFMLGRQVRRHPEIARRVVAEGHSVGSHSYGHKKLTKLKPAKIRWELKKGREALRTTTGVDSRWVRPPYGSMNGAVWEQVRAQRLQVALWNVDSRDWKKPGAKKIAWSVISHVRPGSVILMHDGGGDRRQTIQAVGVIVPKLQEMGYTFVTLDQLADIKRADKAAAKKRAAEKAAAAK